MRLLKNITLPIENHGGDVMPAIADDGCEMLTIQSDTLANKRGRQSKELHVNADYFTIVRQSV